MHDGPINFKNRLDGLLLMRVLWVGLVVLLVSLSGCTDEPDPRPATPEPGQRFGETLPADDPLAAYNWNGTNLIYDELDPPVLEVGTAWTYARSGVWDLTDEVTVVVAKADASGYLFAASSQDDLVNAAVWWVDYLGPRGPDLNLRGTDSPLLPWPLFDGKTWETHGVAVTAVADLIDTPTGRHAGYRIEGSDGARFFQATFVPAVGYLTSYAYGDVGGDTYESIELVSVGQADTGHWFEPGPRFAIATEPVPGLDVPNATLAPYDVPEGYDDILFVGLGTPGGQAKAQPLDPTGGSGWGFQDANGLWDWQVGRVAATPGHWLMSAAKGPEGWAYLEGVAVRWTETTL